MTGNAADRWLDDSADPVRIDVGDWALDRVDAGLSNITFRGVPVLRAIRVVVRDRDWRTVQPRVTNISEHGDADGFRLMVLARCRLDDVDVEWESTLSLSNGELRFDLACEARSSFERNRIGIIVLHWPSDAGNDLRVTHPTAEPTATRLPLRIAPHQPALDIAGLDWTRSGIDVGLRFVGDIFEMEDQRNWTDASFKTYSTPLAEPFPVRIEPGDRVEQSVTVRCAGEPVQQQVEIPDAALGGERRFPSIAVAASTASADSRPEHPVRAPVTVVELDARDASWPAALARVAEDAGEGRLDVRIVARDDDDVATVLNAVAAHRPMKLAVFDATSHVSEPALWQALVAGVAAHGLDAELIAGTRAHFTELNRTHERMPAAPLTFSITPQMHDIERAQIAESIAMQRLVAENAVHIADGEPVHVGPITLRARFNAATSSPYEPDTGTGVESGYGAERVWGATDPRQKSPAMAAWTIASAVALAIDGVASITLGEAWGSRGFGDQTGRFPVADAADLLVARSGEAMRSVEGLPDGCWGVVFPERRELLLANVADDEATFTIEGVGSVTVPALGFVQQQY